MLILIGSEAALQHGISLRHNQPADVDLFSTEKEWGNHLTEHYEGRTVEVFHHPNLNSYQWRDRTANLDELYTIKMSHSYWKLRNNSWGKHVKDMAFLKREGAKLIPELHDLLYTIWEEKHGKKSANLEQNADEFFNSSVERLYEHDSIHAAVAYHNGVPLFNQILRDGHDVAVDRSKFESLSSINKLELVREEVYATALERKLIPSDFTLNPNDAYSYALTQTITSYSKGWFPTFILDNYESLRLPVDNYVETFMKNKHHLVLL